MSTYSIPARRDAYLTHMLQNGHDPAKAQAAADALHAPIQMRTDEDNTPINRNEWIHDRLPDVAKGKRAQFLVTCRSKYNGKLFVTLAAYCNEYWMEWSDSCDPADDDVDENGGKHWTGWMDDRLDTCGDEVSWDFEHDVIAWMPLPAPPEPRTAEQDDKAASRDHVAR